MCTCWHACRPQNPYLIAHDPYLHRTLCTNTVCVCACVCACLKECETFKFSPSVFVCHHPPTHTHTQSYFYSHLALCHITWQRGSPPVEHACSTCKNTTAAQRKYLTSLKKNPKKRTDLLQAAASGIKREVKWIYWAEPNVSSSPLKSYLYRFKEWLRWPYDNSLSV